MAYQKQTFVDDETTLTAEHLINIEEGIMQNESDIKGKADLDESGKLKSEQLPEAALTDEEVTETINTALAQAKESGEFKGDKGDKGDTGSQGAKGDKGADGVSCTHSWNGTSLTVTSASGTSSADLKGEKGDTGEKGDKGDQGEQGIQGIQGEQGEKGDKGDKGDTGATGSKGADGYTPIKGVDYFTSADKAELVSQVKSTCIAKNQGSANVGKILVVDSDGNLTLADMPEIGESGDVIGTLDDNNNILLSGDLADGTYTLKYENADGTYTEVGTLQVGELSVVSISATKTKTNYTVGETLNTDDITATVTYSDGSTKTVTDFDTDSSAVQMGTAGSYNLFISFGGVSTTISITVAAVTPTYTNLFVVDGEGYLVGGRCGSDGTDRTGDAEGRYVTNYIPVAVGDVVRVQGLEVATGGSAYSGIYKSDKTAIKGFYPTSSYTDCVTDINYVADNYTCTFTIAHAEAGFIRLCGTAKYLDPNNIIITVNQEIV